MRLVVAVVWPLLVVPALGFAAQEASVTPPAPASASAAFVALEPLVVWLIILVINLLILYGVRQVVRGLDLDPEWTMSRALSENTVVEQTHPTERDQNGQPIVLKAPLPSSSRLIALLGMIVIMGIFLGMGDVIIWSLATSGKLPDLEKAKDFLYAGAALFAPYLISQTREALKAFGSQPQAPAPTPNPTPGPKPVG